jgi:hypothetical protein
LLEPQYLPVVPLTSLGALFGAVTSHKDFAHCLFRLDLSLHQLNLRRFCPYSTRSSLTTDFSSRAS